MAKQQIPPGAKSSLPLGTHRVTDLAQVRALADPLRLRILGALGSKPRTTKQVADLLGEKPTKLYHHIEALERVGLIGLKETRPNRGTLEKYYQAVAAKFQVAVSTLSPEPGSEEELSPQEAMLNSLLDSTRQELVASLHSCPETPKGPEEAPLLARATVRGSGKKIQSVRRRLLRLMEELREAKAVGESTGRKEEPKQETWSLTVVLCPAEKL
jgi:DNA-binding transcriptional ArsR family regulator